jgi:hypothetical protein
MDQARAHGSKGTPARRGTRRGERGARGQHPRARMRTNRRAVHLPFSCVQGGRFRLEPTHEPRRGSAEAIRHASGARVTAAATVPSARVHARATARPEPPSCHHQARCTTRNGLAGCSSPTESAITCAMAGHRWVGDARKKKNGSARAQHHRCHRCRPHAMPLHAAALCFSRKGGSNPFRRRLSAARGGKRTEAPH